MKTHHNHKANKKSIVKNFLHGFETVTVFCAIVINAFSGSNDTLQYEDDDDDEW